MKKIVVTGGDGFVGRHCLDLLLQAGFEVHSISFPGELPESENLYCYCCDLHDYSQISDLFMNISPTYLLHLAWYTEPGQYINSPENIRWVQSSLELLKIFKQYGGERLVAAGTCSEYDLKYGYLVEYATPDGNDSIYGTCKSSLARIMGAYSQMNDLSFAWGRIFYLYGPYENHTRLVPYVIDRILNKKTAFCSNPETILDYMFVKDAASAFVALLQSDVTGIINIGSGIPISLYDLLCKIDLKLGKQNLVSFKHSTTASKAEAFIVANNEKLRTQLGWSPIYTLDEGLDETIAWWKVEHGRR